MIRMAALGLVLALPATPTLAAPRTETVAGDMTRVSCGPAGGAWRALGEGGQGGQRQYAVDPWATYTFSCRVGGRLLVVRHQTQPGDHGPCSGATNVRVSAWVNGVKVLSRAPVGDYEACFSGQAVETVVRISLTAKGLTVCRALTGPAEQAVRRQCRATPMTGSRDPAYAPPQPHPPVRLRMTLAKVKACGRWGGRLALLKDGADRSFAADEVPQAAGWRSANDGHSYGFEKTARFDIDNDGAADPVTFRWDSLSWRSHLLAEPNLIVSQGLGQQFFRFAAQPVRLDGKVLIYLRALPRDGVMGNFDIYMGERADSSRFIVEARPDGTTQLLCGWGPERRPEDAL